MLLCTLVGMLNRHRIPQSSHTKGHAHIHVLTHITHTCIGCTCKHVHMCTNMHMSTHIHTNVHTHTRHYTDSFICTYVYVCMNECTCTNTHNTYLHLRTRGCYSTDGIRADGLYHVVELLSLNVCHLSCLCDLKFILFPDIFGLRFSGTCQPLQF